MVRVRVNGGCGIVILSCVALKIWKINTIYKNTITTDEHELNN